MAKTNIFVENAFPFGLQTIGQNQVVNFEFQFLPEYNIDDIKFGWSSESCNCFSWHYDEANRKIKGSWTVDKMPRPNKIGRTKKTATISFELKNSVSQYTEALGNNGKRTLARTNNQQYLNSLVTLTVDGWIERLT